MAVACGTLHELRIAHEPFASVRDRGLESADGGASWGKSIPAPKEMKGIDALSWMEYDPLHDTLYVMKMRSELFRWQRK